MKSHPAQFPLCRSKRSPSSSFRARQSGEPGRLAWQPGPWPAATPGRWPTWVLPNLLPPLCVFFVIRKQKTWWPQWSPPIWQLLCPRWLFT